MPDRTQPAALSGRDLATVLAALRLYQAVHVENRKGWRADDIRQIATDGGTLAPLTSPEIDRLCERINLDCETDRSF